MGLRRPDLYVVARFLDVLYWKRSGMKKTHLQMAVRLNYQTFLKYLEWLENHGLIEAMTSDEKSRRIRLSEKGNESYRRLVEWIKETIEDLKI